MGGDVWSTASDGGLLSLLLFLLMVAVLAFFSVWLLLILLAAPLAGLVRVVLGRSWWVEVRRGWATPHLYEKSGDWAASGERVRELAEGLGRGEVPAANVGLTARPR
jgi:hypothetical protein